MGVSEKGWFPEPEHEALVGDPPKVFDEPPSPSPTTPQKTGVVGKNSIQNQVVPFARSAGGSVGGQPLLLRQNPIQSTV